MFCIEAKKNERLFFISVDFRNSQHNQRNPGSKIGIQYIKWGTYFPRITKMRPLFLIPERTCIIDILMIFIHYNE
jgi:hypothetical protein